MKNTILTLYTLVAFSVTAQQLYYGKPNPALTQHPPKCDRHHRTVYHPRAWHWDRMHTYQIWVPAYWEIVTIKQS